MAEHFSAMARGKYPKVFVSIKHGPLGEKFEEWLERGLAKKNNPNLSGATSSMSDMLMAYMSEQPGNNEKMLIFVEGWAEWCGAKIVPPEFAVPDADVWIRYQQYLATYESDDEDEEVSPREELRRHIHYFVFEHDMGEIKFPPSNVELRKVSGFYFLLLCFKLRHGLDTSNVARPPYI